jgi:hypothetical protein
MDTMKVFRVNVIHVILLARLAMAQVKITLPYPVLMSVY